MYVVKVCRHIDAAHFLRGYRGKCEQVHGHRFKIVVYVEADFTGADGMVCDFALLKRMIDEVVVSRYDHVLLNDVAPFDEIDPTAENLAREFFLLLDERMGRRSTGSSPQTAPVRLRCVEVWESPDCCGAFER